MWAAEGACVALTYIVIVKHNFHFGGDSHTWLKNYSEVLERNKSEIYDNLSSMVMQGIVAYHDSIVFISLLGLNSSSNDLLGGNPFLQQYDPSKFGGILITFYGDMACLFDAVNISTVRGLLHN